MRVPATATLAFLAATALLPVSCGQPERSGKPRVVATTTIVGDVVKAVAGDTIELTVLLPVGADPHGFEITPRELVTVHEADLIFLSGLGLESTLEGRLRSAGGGAEIVDVSEGVAVRRLDHGHEEADRNHENHASGEADPHVWTDPKNVAVWVQNITTALSRKNPQYQTVYLARAEAYGAELLKLDAWIRAAVQDVAPEKRKLVCDHEVLGYFADRYGFQTVGAVIPGFSTLAETSPRERADLEQRMEREGIAAVFVSKTANPRVARSLAADLGVKIVTIYTGSLSEPGGEAGSYLEMMRYNVEAIVNALK